MLFTKELNLSKMYTRLSRNATRSYYRSIINRAIEETKELMEMSPQIVMYRSIYNQLLDLRTKVVENHVVISKSELFGRYSLGTIAVKNFDAEHDEYAQRLCDSYSGALDYDRMPEE